MGSINDESPLTALVICGNDFISMRLSGCVRRNSYRVLSAQTAREALSLLRGGQADLILTDLQTEDMDGCGLCRVLRENTQLPLIVVSQKDDIVDKVLSLELGADDFVSFPFDERELSARIKAVRRRYLVSVGDAAAAAAKPAKLQPVKELSETENRSRHEAGSGDDKTLVFPGLTISLGGYVVTCGGRNLPMPPRELELLYFLASAPNQVFTREQLLDQVWGYDYVGDTRTVDVHIKRLRARLKDFHGGEITTVWRVGYKFTLKDAK